jgi:hypothetical protein
MDLYRSTSDFILPTVPKTLDTIGFQRLIGGYMEI